MIAGLVYEKNELQQKQAALRSRPLPDVNLYDELTLATRPTPASRLKIARPDVTASTAQCDVTASTAQPDSDYYITPIPDTADYEN